MNEAGSGSSSSRKRSRHAYGACQDRAIAPQCTHRKKRDVCARAVSAAIIAHRAASLSSQFSKERPGRAGSVFSTTENFASRAAQSATCGSSERQVVVTDAASMRSMSLDSLRSPRPPPAGRPLQKPR